MLIWLIPYFLCLTFRTASDLEELGYIDKQQKGWLKDLIISGDQRLQESLDKFEKGQRDDLIGKYLPLSHPSLFYMKRLHTYSVFIFIMCARRILADLKFVPSCSYG